MAHAELWELVEFALIIENVTLQIPGWIDYDIIFPNLGNVKANIQCCVFLLRLPASPAARVYQWQQRLFIT